MIDDDDDFDYGLPGYTPPAPTVARWRYEANLWLCTPLAVLLQHGRTVPADGIRVEYGRGGRWRPEHEPPAPWDEGRTIDSIGGHVSPDGDDVLPFLRAYRAIIEDESMPVRDRIDAVRELVTQPDWSRWSRSLDRNVHTSWAYDLLASQLGIAMTPAVHLVEMGHCDPAAVWALSDAELADVPGVGRKTLAAIRMAERRGRS